ncbi:MAG: hypothetical protein DI601_11245 [Azospirillum brasilense]|nr:MAG: hypothetical protein DI601_11245 [Azospirillum brasilense]
MGKVLEEHIGTITSPRQQASRIFQHCSHEGTRKSLGNGLPVDPHCVTSRCHVAVLQDDPGAIIGCRIESLAHRRAGLSGLANLGLQAARQHPLGYPVSPDDIEAFAKRSIEGSGLQAFHAGDSTQDASLFFW